jgi:hypothetical protein
MMMSQTVCDKKMKKNSGRWLVQALFISIGVAACATPQEIVTQKEDHLAAAGFVAQPANTPERQAMLNRLPPHHFIRRVHGGTINYVYSDPLVCDCLYVGSQDAYGRYQAYLQQKQLADQQETTAQLYSDGGWNWGAWGPWGPGFVYTPGPGW